MSKDEFISYGELTKITSESREREKMIENDILNIEGRYCVATLPNRKFGGWIVRETKNFFHLKTYTSDGRDYYYCLSKQAFHHPDAGLKFYAEGEK